MARYPSPKTNPYVPLRTLRLLLGGWYTLEDLAARVKRDQRSVKRYIAAMRRAGFTLVSKTEFRGLKYWKAKA